MLEMNEKSQLLRISSFLLALLRYSAYILRHLKFAANNVRIAKVWAIVGPRPTDTTQIFAAREREQSNFLFEDAILQLCGFLSCSSVSTRSLHLAC